MKVSFRRAQSSAKAMSSATKPQPTHTASALDFQQGAFELGVVEVGDARRGAAERHGLVGLADEHGAALGVGVKRDGRDAAPVLGIQFGDGPNQAYRGLTSVDHRDASWGI